MQSLDYASNSIFLPAAGCFYCDSKTLGLQGSNGYYWSSTSNGSNGAYRLGFSSNNQDADAGHLYDAPSVRAVLAE